MVTHVNYIINVIETVVDTVGTCSIRIHFKNACRVTSDIYARTVYVLPGITLTQIIAGNEVRVFSDVMCVGVPAIDVPYPEAIGVIRFQAVKCTTFFDIDWWRRKDKSGNTKDYCSFLYPIARSKEFRCC